MGKVVVQLPIVFVCEGRQGVRVRPVKCRILSWQFMDSLLDSPADTRLTGLHLLLYLLRNRRRKLRKSGGATLAALSNRLRKRVHQYIAYKAITHPLRRTPIPLPVSLRPRGDDPSILFYFPARSYPFLCRRWRTSWHSGSF